MQELIEDFLVLVRGAWRYRWVAVASAWLVAIIGWMVVQVVPDRYTSSTQVFVDTESVLKPLLSGLAINRDVMSQVGMMQAIMLSRPNLEKVAQQADLMLSARSDAEQQAVIDWLASGVNLSRATQRSPGGGRSSSINTFEMSFTSNDPKVSYRVVQTMLDTFIEDSLGIKRSDSGVAQRFLEAQIMDYEQRLTEAEQHLAQFKQENVGMTPGSGESYYGRLEAEAGKLTQLRQTEMQLKAQRDELARQLAGEEPTFGLMGATSSSPIDGQIARFKAARDQLLLQYTEKHPQVQSLNETIARLEEEKRDGARVSSSVSASGAGLGSDDPPMQSLDMNPVYQSLRLNLSQTDAELAALRSQIRGQEALVGELRSRVTAVPEVEAELARLNRDYEVNKKNYDTLLQRLASARISESAEQSSENVKFRIIEPPIVPLEASGPPRLRLNIAVLLVALGIGIGLAVLLAYLHPTFTTRDVLQKVTGLPVLGSISVAVCDVALPWYRKQQVLVVAAVSLLFVVFILNIILTEPLRAAWRAATG